MADDLDRTSRLGGHKKSILEESTAACDVGAGLAKVARGQLANALSASRLVFAAAWIALFTASAEGRAGYIALALAASVTDFIDGRIARRLSTVGAYGRWLDGVADVVFVLAALWCEAAAAAIPIYIPMLIMLSFGQYAVDSLLLSASHRGPIPSRLGHWGGILNYTLVVVLAFAPPPSWPGEFVRRMAPVFALFYAAAIIERALGYRPRSA
jgi:CDP-diacylglycerol--glycerol-3-phosphate 3-phosphatidyltransferase